jgi:hypothetical protein
VKRIVGLELEVQQAMSVTPVCAAPGIVVGGRLEVGTAEQRRNVIEDGAQQCMGGVGVAARIAAELAALGLALPGSLLQRSVRCGWAGRLVPDDRVRTTGSGSTTTTACAS